MDRSTDHAGACINLLLGIFVVVPTALILALSESTAVACALGLALFGLGGLAALVYGRRRFAAAETERYFEIAAAALVAGTAVTLAQATWDLITALYAGCAALSLFTAWIDQRLESAA